MTNCNFVSSFPDYVLDRIIVIEEGHEHKISSYKLATASHYFKSKLKEMREKEIESFRKSLELENEKLKDEQPKKESINSNSEKRKRTKSLSEMELERLIVSYDDITGLEYILSFIHCQSDLSYPELKVSPSNILSILKAGFIFTVPSVLEYCFHFVASLIDLSNCWDYLKIANDILEYHPQLYAFIDNFLLENLTKAANDEKIGEISFEKLREYLQSDKLNCKNEITLLGVINNWIEFDKTNRSKNCPKLIECMRLSKLSNKELDQVSLNFFVKSAGSECSNFLGWCQLSSDDVNKVENGFTPENIERISYMRRSRLPREAIIVVGGWEGNQDDPNFGPSKAIQIYDNRADTWKRLVTDSYALDEGHAYSGCVLIDLKLYVVGGYLSSGPTQTLKVFDLVTKHWKILSPMHEKRNYISACSLNNFIYAIGGHNGRTRLNSVEKYDTTHNNWIIIAPMKQIRSDAGSDSFQGKVYVCGGFDGHHFYSSVEIYDPEIDQWTYAAPMNNIRSGVSMTALGPYLYSIGGNDGLQRLRTVERYDPERNRWQAMPSMIRQRSNFCVAVLENEIYVMGGWSDESNSTIALAEKWIPSPINEWTTIQPLIMPASANCCCSVFGLDFIQNFLDQ